MKNLDALNELNQDTLAKVALAAAAGLVAAAGAKSIYKKYKEKKLLKKYTGTSQEKEYEEKHRNDDMLPDVLLTGIDVKKYG